MLIETGLSGWVALFYYENQCCAFSRSMVFAVMVHYFLELSAFKVFSIFPFKLCVFLFFNDNAAPLYLESELTIIWSQSCF
jgi:hypothetical protein